MPAQLAPVTELDIDPFALENLLDRSRVQQEIRETAPVVYLNAYGVYATGRYDTIREVFADWPTYQVGAGVGLANFHTESPGARRQIRRRPTLPSTMLPEGYSPTCSA